MEPENTISFLFTAAVGIVVFLTIYTALFGGNTQKIVNAAIEWAVPFLLFLVVLYIVLTLRW